MFDTYITVCGNVLAAPTWRRTARTQALVASFRIASTARRYDKEAGAWVDGDSVRLRVNCWRRLAEGVAASVMAGDPVVVAGRLVSRDWTDAAGAHRVSYELEADAVGHDLARGRSAFTRSRGGVPPAQAPLPGEAYDDGPDVPVAAAWGGNGPPAHRWGAGGGGTVPDEPPRDAVAVARGGGFPEAAEAAPGSDGQPRHTAFDGPAAAEECTEVGARGRPARQPAEVWAVGTQAADEGATAPVGAGRQGPPRPAGGTGSPGPAGEAAAAGSTQRSTDADEADRRPVDSEPSAGAAGPGAAGGPQRDHLDSEGRTGDATAGGRSTGGPVPPGATPPAAEATVADGAAPAARRRVRAPAGRR